MEKALLNNQTNTKADSQHIIKLRKDIAFLERDLRRAGNLLHSDAIWELANEKNYPEVCDMLQKITDHAGELLDWVKIHEGTLIKKNKEVSSKAE